MEDLSHMLVLGNHLANLGNIDVNVVKEVFDAHNARRGKRYMPDWSVIVISSDSEDEDE